MSDAKELREAIRDCEFYLDGTNYKINIDSIHKVVEAAKRDLATLPREVEVEWWAIVTDAGTVWETAHSESAVKHYQPSGVRTQVVRLSGTALLPGSKE